MNNNIELRFESPWLLLLLLPALALVLVPWLRLPKAGRRGASRILPVVLHGLLAAALVFVLSGGALTRTTPPEVTDAPEKEVEERAGVLIIADSEGEAEALLPYLPEDMPADISVPWRAPSALDALSRYEKIFLLGVSADELPARMGGQLALYVQDGGSLLISGGRHSYGCGGMRGTAYESLLPVSFDYTAEAGERVALMLVLDCSNSMTGMYGWGWGWDDDIDNLSMAKQGAIRSIEALGEGDTVGVVSFNRTASLESPLVPVTDTEKAALARTISALGTARGTYYCDALELAREQLTDADAEVRHVIFLSDGEPSDSGYLDIVEAMADEGITLTSIALGYSSPVLSSMAREGGGRYYAVTTVEELPDIMLGETETVMSDPLIETETAVALPGGIPADLPAVEGYLGTTLRDTAELLLQTDGGDPILARWTVGDGEADAFTSDLLTHWTDAWRETNPGRSMLRQILSMGLAAPAEEDGEGDAPVSEPLKRTADELLLPLGILLLLAALADIALRKLRGIRFGQIFARNQQ